MLELLIVSSLLGFAACLPLEQKLYGNFSTVPLSPEDRIRLEQLSRPRAGLPAGFKRLYVSQSGSVAHNTKPATGHWIEIAGSPRSSDRALLQAAREISKMLSHAPAYIFNNIANHEGCGVGIFTASEKIVVFPEFMDLADTPACRDRCDGECGPTCTFDGRKFEDIAGVTSTRSIVLEDNVLCTAHDPYSHYDNILVHEFAHSVESYGLSSSEKNQEALVYCIRLRTQGLFWLLTSKFLPCRNHIREAKLTQAYENAREQSLWYLSSYAMGNEAEYFGEGTGAFFLVNLQDTTGGMTDCPGHTCETETEVRSFMRDHDPLLYRLLSHVYFNGNPVSPSKVTICPV